MTAMKRAVVRCNDDDELIEEFLHIYNDNGDPCVHRSKESLDTKEVAAEPAAPHRSRIRKQCQPKGPVGLPRSMRNLRSSRQPANQRDSHHAAPASRTYAETNRLQILHAESPGHEGRVRAL